MFELDDPHATISLENLDRQRTVIGLEAVSLSQTLSAVNTLAVKLPAFVEDVKNFITTTLNPFSPSIILVDSRKLEAKLRTIDYVAAANLGVFVPAGFQGSWLEYTMLLSRSQKVLDTLRDGLLKPYELYLAQLLTAPQHLRDNSVSPALARYSAPDTDALRKDFAAFFTTKQSTESTYGEVVKRHAELGQITHNLNEVNTRFAAIDRTVLVKQVASISDLLSKLIANIKEHGEEYIVSGATLKALTNLTYFMAREIEFYTTHGYFLDAFTLSVRDSYKRLEKAVER